MKADGFDPILIPWDNRNAMKRTMVLAFALVFALCMFHYYFAEDHCPVHCPSRAAGFGHVHAHHPSGDICLCFWASMDGPEAIELGGVSGFVTAMAAPSEGRPLGRPAADIAHPPKFRLV
jgi:hypothetical protein